VWIGFRLQKTHGKKEKEKKECLAAEGGNYGKTTCQRRQSQSSEWQAFYPAFTFISTLQINK